jgi:mRNA-degrading endonuclease toxin of MazEF toxin-antitoxin module/predicted transcriptional regulator
MPASSLRLPHDLERRLAEEARHCGQPRSELTREALEELLRRRKQECFMAGLVVAAEALVSDPSARVESLDVAADFVQADPITQAGLATVIVVPLTTRDRPGTRALRVSIRSRDRLICDSYARADQPRSLDRSRPGDGPLAALSPEELTELEQTLLGECWALASSPA